MPLIAKNATASTRILAVKPKENLEHKTPHSTALNVPSIGARSVIMIVTTQWGVAFKRGGAKFSRHSFSYTRFLSLEYIGKETKKFLTI